MLLDIATTMSDEQFFAPWFRGDSWNPWRAVLKAAFALPMTTEEVAFFRTVADREPPIEPVKELWCAVGRRAGKDSIGSAVAAHVAAFFGDQERLRPGEKALLACLAVDRDQARIVLRYVKAFFHKIPALGAMVTRETAAGFELDNGVDIAIATNSFRQVRGRPILAAILDECAFYRDENSATPDRELYQALKPGLATLPGAMIIGISSPYRRAGLLYEKWRKHYGQDGDVLVIKAPSIVFNPTLDRSIIDRAYEEDPAAAAAEWGAEWRSDIAAFVDPEVVDACIAPGRHELPPVDGVVYTGAFDAAGGAGGGDSFTSAIAHFDAASGRVVLDATREEKPPFSPEATIEEHAQFFLSYGLRFVQSDRWAGQFPAEQFRKHGVDCSFSERVKSDIYKELLPLLNSGRVELIDNRRLVTQLCNLERRTARGGRDSIDHPVGSHDDLINSAALALLGAQAPSQERSFMWATGGTPGGGFGASNDYERSLERAIVLGNPNLLNQ